MGPNKEKVQNEWSLGRPVQAYSVQRQGGRCGQAAAGSYSFPLGAKRRERNKMIRWIWKYK